ncbi:Putative transcriptional regulator [Candidatus Glomeribacter gigasporarum BEG34]|uniref:Putative transcriptional regulator n=1 Tax=Candidatus Glomeribacter gigasporarum BEG34 TaxID=1070319 RepID=G2J7B0_9BURK|nr:LuxR C-terminal-related transcriptional regulator [Candidatus Glomeribacter gigasporarum]CCD28650.1 Putative transcriptional regulator [Candidatus Glomeribacter gigasporarum BEG34]
MNAAHILPDLKRISCSGEFLSDFVEKFPHSSHVKDAHTKKYLVTNHHMVVNCGLQTVDDIIGFTPQDILFDNTIQQKRNLNQITISNHSKSIQFNDKIEKQILSTKHSISTERFILSSRGNVEFQNVTKVGVQNYEHKIIAFLSVFFDLTRQVSLHKLFRLYQEFYPRKEAIQKFLNHFNIEGYFEPLALLTNTEIQILISMRDDSRCKAVANALGISVATASNHISNIRSKLNSGTLHDVLLKLPAIPESEQSMYAYV